MTNSLLLVINTTTIMDLDLATLNAAIGRAVPAMQVPDTWNGSLGHVDLAKPTDHVGEWGKIVLNNNQLSLRGTIEYYIWLAQDKPGVAINMTQDHVNKVIDPIRTLIARYRIYAILRLAGAEPSYRMSDTVEPNYTIDAAKQVRAAREIYAMLTGDAVTEAAIAEIGRFVLYSFIANAIHREQNDKHSWFTEEMMNPRSPTSKTLAVAGRHAAGFKVYMQGEGHDGNHHLPDTKLDEYARMLCGNLVATMPMPVGGIQYAGNDIQGMDVTAVFQLGEAVKDRYPAGILGKAAIIIGLGMTTTMMLHLSTKVMITGAGAVTANAPALIEQISKANFDHKTLLEIGRALGPMLSFVFGFVTKSSLVEESEYKAFENHAKRFPSDLASGVSLALSLKRAAPHVQALSGGVVAAINRLAVSLMAAAQVSIDTLGTTVLVAPTLIVPGDVTAAVGNISTSQGFYDADMD